MCPCSDFLKKGLYNHQAEKEKKSYVILNRPSSPFESPPCSPQKNKKKEFLLKLLGNSKIGFQKTKKKIGEILEVFCGNNNKVNTFENYLAVYKKFKNKIKNYSLVLEICFFKNRPWSLKKIN